MEKLSLTWDLESIYAGGSSSAQFQEELAGMERNLAEMSRLIQSAGSADNKQAVIVSITELVQQILLALRQSDSFVGCLMAQNVGDAKAIALNDRVKTISAQFNGLLTSYDELLASLQESEWEQLLQIEAMNEVSFQLDERRKLMKEKLAPAMEALVEDLAVDGYHGWGDFYHTIVGRAKFQSVAADGTAELLSAGQMQNRLSEPDRDLRAAAFAEWEKVWGEQAELCAEVINRISGFRLKLYNKRGWQSALKEPLQMCRMSEKTLNAMWDAVVEGKKLLIPYLQRKASLLGVDKLDWHDVEAPLGKAARTVPYEEAAAFIVQQFRGFSSELAEFADMAIRKRWIEAEDRAGKRPGGFCTSLPKSGETRIFMTYSGSASNISTLAHELGHAYHQHVMNDLQPLAQEYAMNVAETASTFAELIVSEGAYQAATDKEEQLGLLEDKIQRAVAFYMNIHARFLFETRFYERRKQGIVSSDELNALMEEAQREAYSDMLGELHPHFWASKLHFYLTDVPFYNFPYTFGFLFSAGIYAIAKQEGEAFSSRYVALLRDTGSMKVEELAKKHLEVDLEQKQFWQAAVDLVRQDVDAFLALTDQR